MPRLEVETSVDELAWESASAARPCPVCGADCGCRVHSREGFVCCAHVRSEWPLTTGAWLHRDPRPAGRSSSVSSTAQPSVSRSRVELALRFERRLSDHGHNQ